MICSDGHNRNKLTDAQLDALLIAADVDLLAYAQANAHPEKVLNALTDPISLPWASAPADTQEQHGATGSFAVALLSARLNCDDCIAIINNPLLRADASHVFDRSLVLARALELDLELARIRAVNPHHAGILDEALDCARILSNTFVRTRFSSLDFRRTRRRIRALINRICSFQLDVSDTDLSSFPIRDLDQLHGVIWNEETVWPQKIAGRVKAGSREVRPGVYQVRGGNEHQDTEVWV